MYCTNCGNKIGAEARFCADCGAARAGDSVSQGDPRGETCVVQGGKTGVGLANKAMFWAAATGPNGTYIVAATPQFQVDAESVLSSEDVQRKYCDRPLNSLAHKLENDGWEQQSQGGQNWYNLRFKRITDQQQNYPSPEAEMSEPAVPLPRAQHLWLLASGLGAVVASFFLFTLIPFFGFLCLATGIAMIGVAKFGLEWTPSRKKVVTIPRILFVAGGLLVGYMFGLMI
jgi:hypothetical protein